MPEPPNYRQQVDQWFARHKQYRMTTTYEGNGPSHAQIFQCTYHLNGTTPATGEWKKNKPDAKESAAREAIKILHSWTPYVCQFSLFP